jgi:hypothetical protein
VQKYTPE